VVKGLQPNTNALSSHTKNNGLKLIFLNCAASQTGKTERGIYQTNCPAQQVFEFILWGLS
jgi:hypothetical protein